MAAVGISLLRIDRATRTRIRFRAGLQAVDRCSAIPRTFRQLPDAGATVLTIVAAASPAFSPAEAITRFAISRNFSTEVVPAGLPRIILGDALGRREN